MAKWDAREPVWCPKREIEARFENSAASGLLPATSQIEMWHFGEAEGCQKKGCAWLATRKAVDEEQQARQDPSDWWLFEPLMQPGLWHIQHVSFWNWSLCYRHYRQTDRKASAVPFFSRGASPLAMLP